MEDVPSSTEGPHKQKTALVTAKPLRVWLIIISILAGILFLIDAVLSFAIIGTSVDHLKAGTKSISATTDITVPYSVNDFYNDLEVEIPSILVSFIVLVSGPLGGWLLRKRKPKLAFALSLLVVVSIFATILLGLLLVFS